MNFFEHQDNARRRTRLLAFNYVLAVGLIILAIYGVAISLVTYAGPLEGLPTGTLWIPELFLPVALFTLAIIALGTMYKIFTLRSGGRAVAEMLGGRVVTGAPTDPSERRLLNVVEEMAIASGIPVPTVYVMDNEAGINAFAAGLNTSDAVVAVTRGTLEQLNRDQLQGVIGHEFSHILNGDMRLNLRLMGILHGILLISLIGYGCMRAAGRSRRGRRSGKGAAGLFLVGLALYIIGWVGVFFGNLIKAAVSRQREFLADASAVQFTRNPDGLKEALSTIGSFRPSSTLQHPSAPEASHFYFANGLTRSLNSLFATHPPLDERIKRIDPAWGGQPGAETGAPKKTDHSPANLLGFAGRPGPSHLRAATQLVNAIPSTLQDALRSPDRVAAIAYALLLADASPDRVAQHREQISASFSPSLAADFTATHVQLSGMTRSQRVPILDLAIPAFRRLPRAQYDAVRKTLLAIVSDDEQVDLHEFVIMRTLLHHMDRHFGLRKAVSASGLSSATFRDAAACLMSALAWLGTGDAAAAQQAYAAGLHRLGHPNSAPALSGRPPTLTQIEEALDTFEGSTHQQRQVLLEAAAVCISMDRRLTAQEAELFRAMAASLDCPLPPLPVDAA